MADYRIPGQWVKDGMVFGAPVTPESIDNLKRFVMGENDVLVATYPKTGEKSIGIYLVQSYSTRAMHVNTQVYIGLTVTLFKHDVLLDYLGHFT